MRDPSTLAWGRERVSPARLMGPTAGARPCGSASAQHDRDREGQRTHGHGGRRREAEGLRAREATGVGGGDRRKTNHYFPLIGDSGG
jgi:hypothetical protein